MSMLEPTAPSAVPAMPRRFCRRCGYDLRASMGRCPDCGRGFDADNPRTYLRRPPRALYRWLRRLGGTATVLVLLAAGAFAWIWHGWHEEQRRLAQLRSHMDDAANQLAVTTEPLSPWLRQRLPNRIGMYVDRVADIQLYEPATDDDLDIIQGFSRLHGLMLQGPLVTDAGLAHLKSLTRMQTLYLDCNHITDAGLANFEDMQQMQDLLVEGGEITDAGLEHLHHMPALRNFTICQNRVTRAGLHRWMSRHQAVWVTTGPLAPVRYSVTTAPSDEDQSP